MIDGVVTYAGFNSGYGAQVVVKGVDGIYRRYAVHGQYLVQRGQQVKLGQVIGIIDKGHLHYEEIHPTRPDGSPNSVYQEFERNGNANTSFQRGTTNPQTSLDLKTGTRLEVGKSLKPPVETAEEEPSPLLSFSQRARASRMNLKINVRGPRGVRVSSESSGAVSPATISREMDPSGGGRIESPA
jgi:hypothetical protein